MRITEESRAFMTAFCCECVMSLSLTAPDAGLRGRNPLIQNISLSSGTALRDQTDMRPS